MDGILFSVQGWLWLGFGFWVVVVLVHRGEGGKSSLVSKLGGGWRGKIPLLYMYFGKILLL